MRLIADSGASKTDWVWLPGNGEVRQFQTQGLNPFYIDTAGITNVVAKELIPFIEPELVREIHFYGAGCSSVLNTVMVEDALSDLFQVADISIYSDLLGSARAMLGKGEGIACILGTGSNSCHYDGDRIVRNIPSLGYFFGDEGSGAHIGKMLCTGFMLEKLPTDLQGAFTARYGITRENILLAVYKMPFPNRYLASFSLFLQENITHAYVIELVSDSFGQFFSNTVSAYEGYRNMPVHFTGSVAFFFQDILRSVAGKYDINIKTIERSPLQGLIKFHS